MTPPAPADSQAPPSLYDKTTSPTHSQHQSQRQSASTIRVVTPEGDDNGYEKYYDSFPVPTEWDRDVGFGQTQHAQHVGEPARNASSPPTGMLARTDSRSDGNEPRGVPPSTARPRTKTLEERSRRDRSPASVVKSRNRIGSVHIPGSAIYQESEYLASVPATTCPPSLPSISSLGSPAVMPVEFEAGGRRSLSPSLSNNGDPTSVLPTVSQRRVEHLMRTLNGQTSGSVTFRYGASGLWTQSYCYTSDSTPSLIYEPPNSEGVHRILIPDLRGCVVRPQLEGDTPYLEISSPHSELVVHLKLATQVDFDAWYATLMFWANGGQSPQPSQQRARPPSSTDSNGNGTRTPVPPLPPTHPRRKSTAHVDIPQNHRDRAMSSKSDRRKSTVTLHKESPVIKIGKMIIWDTSMYSNNGPPRTSHGQHSTARPSPYRMQSYGSRRWRRISGQLRESGELKLHSDADNSLISVVELSQLSRCALQRLDSSVLDCDFCIAIYPQYMAVGTATQPGFVRPIFLSLESRVLYEVWFVLLRAFTVPQLYGPSLATMGDDSGEQEEPETLPPGTSQNMFRVERSLTMRIVEAKMYPATGQAVLEPGFGRGHGRGMTSHSRSEAYGHYAEVLLDDETRGKTSVKFEGLKPLWGESFEFLDLPSTLQSAGVVLKRRPSDTVQPVEHKVVHETFSMNGDPHGGYTGLNADVIYGRVDISELEEEKEVEKWWPLTNSQEERVGDILIKVRADERVILMARDYQPLSDLLHHFSNNLTLHIAHVVTSDLRRLSDCLLNILQVSGKASEWLTSLAEEEIDGLHKETPLSRLRYSKRVGSEVSNDGLGNGGSNTDRELLVRDLNKNATLEANLLFRGNTLLTKSLDTHMRRVGKEYLEECLTAKIQEINDQDLDCEVDPNRVSSSHDLDRNWRRLNAATADVWKAIFNNKQRCPIELRIIFRHIRACAEDKYGDFLRSVSYSSVSGFLFLRFFCPAVLNPKLFGLLKDDIKPRPRRTLTLIAKSLQTMANLASFGTKEHWMEPMNHFLNTHRNDFKTFIEEVCYVPAPISGSSHNASTSASPAYAPGYYSSETNLSYTTPMTIMQRLPPTSREGFPSLPYLIDQARAMADLVQLWLDATNPQVVASGAPSVAPPNAQRRMEILQAIRSEPNLLAFHEACEEINRKTIESLNRAERADPRPYRSDMGALDPIALIDSLHGVDAESHRGDEASDLLADIIAHESTALPRATQSLADHGTPRRANDVREWDQLTDDEGVDVRSHNHTPVGTAYDVAVSQHRDRPSSAGFTAGNTSNFTGSFRRVLASRDSDHSPASVNASVSNLSSAVSSDTERATTALPSYERELQFRERRAVAHDLITQHMEQAKIKAAEKKEKKESKPKTSLGALRKKRVDKGLKLEEPRQGHSSRGSDFSPWS